MSKNDKNIGKESDPSTQIFNRSYGAMKSILERFSNKVLDEFGEYSGLLNKTYQKR